MKKTMFIARPAKTLSVAILASLILSISVADVKAAGSENTAKAGVTYVGAANSIMTFNVNYANVEGQKVVLELTNENGDVLYKRVYAEKNINKNIYIKNDGEKCRVKFTLRSGKDVIDQKFDIEPQINFINETVVTKI